MASYGGAHHSSNHLISSQSNSELQVVLHPLVLLAISDYITRHTLRAQSGPIVGALLGQQNGREITIEHAFDCKMGPAPGESDSSLALDSLDLSAFNNRLEQSTRALPPPPICSL
jgi:COP9 signalosome complex subunit 6